MKKELTHCQKLGREKHPDTLKIILFSGRPHRQAKAKAAVSAIEMRALQFESACECLHLPLMLATPVEGSAAFRATSFLLFKQGTVTLPDQRQNHLPKDVRFMTEKGRCDVR